MSMNVNAASESYGAYAAKPVEKTEKADTAKKAEAVAAKEAGEVAATYEKSEDKKAESGTYKINKMSEKDRTALVNQLKADQEQRQSQLIDLVKKMFQGQATTAASADDSIWKFLADGNFTVDAATKAQAQEDISEDGYWGVKQTSQRLFDFASALAGDDVDKMKKMQDAMMKGYEQATATWGKELPSISKDTIDAANKLFDDYYASKGVEFG